MKSTFRTWSSAIDYLQDRRHKVNPNVVYTIAGTRWLFENYRNTVHLLRSQRFSDGTWSPAETYAGNSLAVKTGASVYDIAKRLLLSTQAFDVINNKTILTTTVMKHVFKDSKEFRFYIRKTGGKHLLLDTRYQVENTIFLLTELDEYSLILTVDGVPVIRVPYENTWEKYIIEGWKEMVGIIVRLSEDWK